MYMHTESGSGRHSVSDIPKLDSISLIGGHFFYGLHQSLDVKLNISRCCACPLARLISEYNHAVTVPEHILHDRVKDMDFESYISNGHFLSTDNLQTRMLCGGQTHPFFGEVNETHLEKAKENLLAFQAFGITEEFHESLILFSRVLGWDPEKLGYRAQRKSIKATNSNEISARVRSLVEYQNRFDVQLYDFAKQEFSKRIAAAQDDAWQESRRKLDRACEQHSKDKARSEMQQCLKQAWKACLLDLDSEFESELARAQSLGKLDLQCLGRGV